MKIYNQTVELRVLDIDTHDLVELEILVKDEIARRKRVFNYAWHDAQIFWKLRMTVVGKLSAVREYTHVHDCSIGDAHRALEDFLNSSKEP